MELSCEITEPQAGQINTAPKIPGLLIPELSLEVFLRGATAFVKVGTTGLLSNGLVRQVEVPLNPSDPSQCCFRVEFKQIGSDTFSQVAGLVTESRATLLANLGMATYIQECLGRLEVRCSCVLELLQPKI